MNKPIWLYKEYSGWARLLAKEFTKKELEKELNKTVKELSRATNSHLQAIQESTSMTSNSSARVNSRNVIANLGDQKMAIENALEIHMYYPEKAKKE